MNNDASLREYYIKLQKLYNNAVNILAGIEQSLSSASPEIEVPIVDSDDTITKIRIPSFLYLESSIENISSIINKLFDIPNSGEAWFSNDDASFKLSLLRSNSAPIAPILDTAALKASSKENNILKDIVFPKTYMKINVSQIPENISELLIDKIIIYKKDIYDAVVNSGTELTYANCQEMLYNYVNGEDYSEYETLTKMQIYSDHYMSSFKINKVLNDGNAWKDETTSKLCYSILLDTLIYYDRDDNSISYSLKKNDLIILGNSSTIYKVKDIFFENNNVVIEEYVGHSSLMPYEENTEMVFQIYNENYDAYKNIDIPLEEDQYLIIFVASVWNNIRSQYSLGVPLDMSTIKMVDKYSNPIVDSNGNQYTYINYYNDYCNNVGDFIVGMSKAAFSQLSNYTSDILQELTESSNLQSLVTESLKSDSISVIPINKHLSDDATSEEIIKLHNEKNDLNAQLQTCQSNINNTYSTLLTTDFSQNVTVTQDDLNNKLQQYYTERTNLQQQLNAVVENISLKSDLVNDSIKYRIRGTTVVSALEANISENYLNAEIIGIDVEYKYKNSNKDNTTVSSLNNTIFTDWNKQHSIEKGRKLVFSNNGYKIEFCNYENSLNTIKWNQIDIPIKYGEDVVVRIRYKYSIGQPFISLYTPWSDELTFTFPTEYAEDTEIKSIIATNEKDSISSMFSKTLIDNGYSEHIQNKILSNQQTFFHKPENIYSGFNTAENNLISLKDKLMEMSSNIESYKSYIESLSNTSFEVYLNYDDNSVLLSPNSINKINIYNTEHISDSYIHKNMNIVIKNTGSARLSLYSIFPGNIDEHLITSDVNIFGTLKSDYERVPIFINGKLDGQYLGQYIYFRSNNPYSKADLYFDDIAQNMYDYNTILTENEDNIGSKILTYKYNLLDYISKNNEQVLLPFVNNIYISGFKYTDLEGFSSDDDTENEKQILAYVNSYKDKDSYNKFTKDFNTFLYKNYNNDDVLEAANKDKTKLYNQYVAKYSDIVIYNEKTGNSYITENTSLNDVLNKIFVKSTLFNAVSDSNIEQEISISDTSQLIGAFLYPNLLAKSQISTDDINGIKYIEVGSSLSIPIVFEYYVEASMPNITKTMAFDLKNSVFTDPKRYILEITGNYDYTTTGEIYKDIDNII